MSRHSNDANLTSGTLAGLRWTYLATGVAFAMQLGYQAVINRLLEPAAFGIVAIATIALRFAQHFAELGIGSALIQKPKLDDDDVRVAFTSSLLFGLFAFAVVWVIAVPIERFFDAPGAAPILRAMGTTLFFSSIGGAAAGVLRRQLRFRVLAVREIVAYVVGYPIVGVGLAVAGAGVWSLVAAAIISALLSAVIDISAARPAMRPLLTWRRVRTLYGFGGRIGVIGFLEFTAQNLDTFVVGRYATTSMLGQYSRAYYLTSMPIGMLTRSLGQVLFPGFSRIQQDTVRMKRVYLSAISLAAYIMLPVCLGMAIAAPELVMVVLGPQWEPAMRILPILAIGSAFRVMSHFSGILCDARGELNKKLALQVIVVSTLAGLLLLARGGELWGYALAWTGTEVVRQLLYMFLVHRILGVGIGDLGRAYTPALAAAGLVAGMIAAGRLALDMTGVPAFFILVCELLLGGAGLVIALRSPPLRRVRSEARMRLMAAGLSQEGRAGRLATAVLGSR